MIDDNAKLNCIVYAADDKSARSRILTIYLQR